MKAFLKEKVYASVARVRMNNREMEISSGVRVEPALQTKGNREETFLLFF
jgi:hypothetical protein